MHRTLFEIPIPFLGKMVPIHSYGFMMAVGFFVAVFAARWRAKKEGMDPGLMSDLGIYVICSGIVGARLFFVIQNFDEYKNNLIDVFKVYEGGLVFYGSLIGVVLFFVVFVRRKKIDFLKTMDVIFPSATIGLAFGRIGCFLNGCCYGDVAGSWSFCAVRFPKTSDVFERINGSPVFLRHYEKGLVDLADNHSLPVHPTQLYAFFSCVLIFFILNTFWKYRKRDGEVMLLFGVIYSIYRFCIEFVRDDNPPLFDSLTISQNISIFVFVISATFFVLRRLNINKLNRVSV